MQEIDEGYIKFQIDWKKSNLPEDLFMDEMIAIRNRLYQLNFIGNYSDQIGYGNISMRLQVPNAFVISGTQTGNIAIVDRQNFSIVNHVQVENNFVKCCGPSKASSESMTHDAIYKSNIKIRAVIHAHHFKLWKYLLYNIDTIPIQIKYGSIEMANNVLHLLGVNNAKSKGIFVTEGHEEGIFTYGTSVQEAFDILDDYSKKIG